MPVFSVKIRREEIKETEVVIDACDAQEARAKVSTAWHFGSMEVDGASETRDYFSRARPKVSFQVLNAEECPHSVDEEALSAVQVNPDYRFSLED